MLKNIITTKVVMIILLVSFILGFIFQSYLEMTHKSDSIGFLYTLYGSVVFTVILSIFLIIVYCAYKLIMNRRA
jgi:uncharacterized BrkB/YihY/UPF0761 family membrane protein